MLDPWHTLYPSANNHQGADITPWGSGTVAELELDLRQEMREFLHGSTGEIAKGRTGLLRRMRTNSDGEKIKCPCRDTVTDEPDRDYYCRTCNGVGYLWDERELVYYKDDGSLEIEDETFFYMEYFVKPSKDDYIVELIRDVNGNVISQSEREAFYKVIEAEPFRADNGRIEYWRCRAEKERKWSVWYGTTPRQHDPTAGS